MLRLQVLDEADLPSRPPLETLAKRRRVLEPRLRPSHSLAALRRRLFSRQSGGSRLLDLPTQLNRPIAGTRYLVNNIHRRSESELRVGLLSFHFLVDVGKNQIADLFRPAPDTLCRGLLLDSKCTCVADLPGQVLRHEATVKLQIATALDPALLARIPENFTRHVIVLPCPREVRIQFRLLKASLGFGPQHTVHARLPGADSFLQLVPHLLVEFLLLLD